MPRLSVELVPRLAWGKNVRAVVAADTWAALRWHFGATLYSPPFRSIDFPTTTSRFKLKCAFCHTEQKKLELHEQWRYDDERAIQRLIGLKPICSKCHLVKHLGYAVTKGRGDEVLAHLAQINDWTPRQAEKLSEQAFAAWSLRSQSSYTLDLTYLARHIPASKIHLDWLESPRTWVGSKLDAITWADRLLHSDALILDTETTGLLEYNPNVEVIELAVIDMKGKSIYQSLFRPIHSIPRRAISIHGIKNRDVKNAPTFAQEKERIGSLLAGRTVVTFNAKFDREMIAKTCSMYELEMPSCRWECAMMTFRTFSGSSQYLPLPGRSHRALADSKATLKLLRKMARADI